MARSITDRTRNSVNPDQRLARRAARLLDQQRRQKESDGYKTVLSQFTGRRTGTNG